MGCAVGNVSSRIGSIIPDFTGGNDYWHQLFPLNSYSPPLFILADRGVLLKCLYAIGNFDETTDNICGGTFCDNCTQTFAPVDFYTETFKSNFKNSRKYPSINLISNYYIINIFIYTHSYSFQKGNNIQNNITVTDPFIRSVKFK
eukprot:369737_1